MKTLCLHLRFAALFLLIALLDGGAGARPGGPLQLECSTSSVSSFRFEQTLEAEGPDPVSVVTAAVAGLESMMIGLADVECGPCANPAQCRPSLSNLSSTIVIDGPKLVSPGVWKVTASYSGTYHITCGACGV